jgi:hypothetical protein
MSASKNVETCITLQLKKKKSTAAYPKTTLNAQHAIGAVFCGSLQLHT